MIDEIKQLMDQYVAWLRDKTSLRQVGDWVEVTTPYLDRHNDYLQMYVRRTNGGFILTDDGQTINDLKISGCKLDSKKRQDLLRMTLNGFGVQQDGEALTVKASETNFPLRKHNLVQAMLAVNDLFYVASPTVISLFFEDVTAWLEDNEIRFVPKVKFTGKSGYDHVFDFAIPKSKKRPERILRAINRPDREAAQALAFAWIDTKEVRPPDSEAYALLNDLEHDPSTAVLDALKNYDVEPVLWSQREQARDKLAA
jgi:hypothetical protein